MAEYDEEDRVAVRSLAPAGGFGRYGGGIERHIVEHKFEEISRTGSGVERHVVEEKFDEVDTVSRTGGVERHVVKETFEEVDTLRATGGHHHHYHHHGHYGHGVDTGGHHHHHGHYGHGVVRETRVEEHFDPCTGEFHKRKETFLPRDD